MPDEKISQLPPSPGASATDLHEVSNMTGVPVSQKQTTQQLVTLMQTAMALILLKDGKSQLNADGSASFAVGNFRIEIDGSFIFAGGSIQATHLLFTCNIPSQFNDTITAGTINATALNSDTAAVGLSQLNANGSASFANGNAVIDLNGNLQCVGFVIQDGYIIVKNGVSEVVTLRNDDISSFSNGADFGASTTSIDNAGTVNTSTAYQVASTKVVGAQQPAIADAAVLLTDIVTKFNTLLAELRTHGLIAT